MPFISRSGLVQVSVVQFLQTTYEVHTLP